MGPQPAAPLQPQTLVRLQTTLPQLEALPPLVVLLPRPQVIPHMAVAHHLRHRMQGRSLECVVCAPCSTYHSYFSPKIPAIIPSGIAFYSRRSGNAHHVSGQVQESHAPITIIIAKFISATPSARSLIVNIPYHGRSIYSTASVGLPFRDSHSTN